METVAHRLVDADSSATGFWAEHGQSHRQPASGRLLIDFLGYGQSASMLKLNEVKALDGQRVERALIGFVAGGLMGVGFSYLFLRITNLIYAWIGRELVQITWWSVLPFALILGLSMAINMAHPPFGD